jgi:hypothetical protein
VSSSADGLTKDVQGIASIDLTSIPVEMLMAFFPDIGNALPDEKSHAAAFVALNLKSDVLQGVGTFASVFQAESAKMIEILTAAGGIALTPTQQDGLKAAAGALLAGIGAQLKLLQDKSAGAAKLSDAVNSPNGSFLTGRTAIQAAIDKANQDIKDLQGLLNFPGQDQQQIAMGILVKQAQVNYLSGLQSQLQSLIATNKAMGVALSGDLVIWQTLNIKYRDVADHISQVSTAPSILAIGDVRAAQLGWSQLEDYAKGLSAAS